MPLGGTVYRWVLTTNPNCCFGAEEYWGTPTNGLVSTPPAETVELHALPGAMSCTLYSRVVTLGRDGTELRPVAAGPTITVTPPPLGGSLTINGYGKGQMFTVAPGAALAAVITQPPPGTGHRVYVFERVGSGYATVAWGLVTGTTARLAAPLRAGTYASQFSAEGCGMCSYPYGSPWKQY